MHRTSPNILQYTKDALQSYVIGFVLTTITITSSSLLVSTRGTAASSTTHHHDGVVVVLLKNARRPATAPVLPMVHSVESYYSVPILSCLIRIVHDSCGLVDEERRRQEVVVGSI